MKIVWSVKNGLKINFDGPLWVFATIIQAIIDRLPRYLLYLFVLIK